MVISVNELSWKGVQVCIVTKPLVVKCGIDYAEVANLGVQKCNNFSPSDMNIDAEPLILFGDLILANSG